MTREEAIHILEYERDNDIFCSSYRQKVHVAMDMGIEALKGRPKGEWKVRLPKPFLLCECSICGESEEWMSKFCPNCGAKMEPKQTLSEVDNDTAYGGLMSAT